MKLEPKKLESKELIHQLKLDINKLNYFNVRMKDELADLYHPEFGIIYLYRGALINTKDLLELIRGQYDIKCEHEIAVTPDPSCLSCEMLRLTNELESCLNVIPEITKGKPNATTPMAS